MSSASSSASTSSLPYTPPTTRIPVGLAGCTGIVGQRFLLLLSTHPWFIVTAISASDRSSGKAFKDACSWKLREDMPSEVADMIVGPCTLDYFSSTKCRVVFSALDSSIAGEFELLLAQAGFKVFSNAKNHRMDRYVPILIPHANSEHISIVAQQQKENGYEEKEGGKGGYIITNANCSSTGLVVALRPLHDAYTITSLFVTTLQAISGAGYPGVASLDITDNVIPFISGEEEKMEEEPQKILGTISHVNNKQEFAPAPFKVSAQCNRVAVIDGHTECVNIKFEKKPKSIEEVEKVLKEWKSEAQLLQLPSAPPSPIFLHSSLTSQPQNRPQPRLDRDRHNGYVVTVGRVRECGLLDIKFTLCSHNTVLGAAGGSIQNAELAYAKGLI